jgi:orotidine-5'-phosphate decarboxylase
VFVIGVTALTSAEADVSGVVMMSRAAREAGLDGVVVSPREAAPVKEVCGGRFITVTPGIRRTALPSDDQRRTASPAAAIRSGSDFIVVGRPVLAADDPLREVESIISEVASAEVVGRESER